MDSNDQTKNRALSKLFDLTSSFEEVKFEYETLYKNTIQLIAESPYIFNYFHWTTDIKARRIIDHFGIKKILGYGEDVVTFEKMISLIHPKFFPFVVQYAATAYEMLTYKKYLPLSIKAHYSVQYPILCANGKYLLVQMNVSIIVVDAKGNPIVNYNRFEVLGEYLDTPIPIKPRVFFRTGLDLSAKAKEAEKELNDKVKGIFIKIIGLTEKELSVLDYLADNSLREEKFVALKISRETLKTHNKNILTKAKKHISPLFEKARDVAKYLKTMEIV